MIVCGVLIVENEAITGGVGGVCGRGFTSWGSMIGVSVFKT